MDMAQTHDEDSFSTDFDETLMTATSLNSNSFLGEIVNYLSLTQCNSFHTLFELQLSFLLNSLMPFYFSAFKILKSGQEVFLYFTLPRCTNRSHCSLSNNYNARNECYSIPYCLPEEDHEDKYYKSYFLKT